MKLLRLLTLWPWFTIASREYGEPPDVPGVEFTRHGSTLHFEVENKRPHFTARASMLHFSTEEN